jgi:DNA repair exonuclease SbcCD ATPase subunit
VSDPTPDPTIEHAAVDETGELPWSAKMLAATQFTRVGPRRKYYDPGEVDPFVKRAAKRVGELEGERNRLGTQNRALQQQKAVHAGRRPPAMAVDAMVRADDQAESELATVRREYTETRQRTMRLNQESAAVRQEAESLRREAEDYLRVAKTIAEPVDRTERVLPPEPQPTGDIAADIDARSQHLQECRLLLDRWRQEDDADRLAAEEQRRVDDERRAALADKVGRLVESLDQLEAVMPAARARVVDLRDEIAETTETDVAEAS